ncbi:peptidyl-tRNA hydrolase, partial [Buchnera aphidicola]|nr:peptidyl-tRNA hydrolase [Buchnera aphidicola]
NGRAVYRMASFYGIQLSEILIIHDDLDLKPGLFKLTYSYGHSGHNGLRNVLSYFSNKENFFRCRIGIGRPFYKSEIASFVLSAPTD